jgi:hypothetical protein
MEKALEIEPFANDDFAASSSRMVLSAHADQVEHVLGLGERLRLSLNILSGTEALRGTDLAKLSRSL